MLPLIVLIELVLESKNQAGRTFEFMGKTQNERNQLLSAPSSVSRRNWMRVDEGPKGQVFDRTGQLTRSANYCRITYRALVRESGNAHSAVVIACA